MSERQDRDGVRKLCGCRAWTKCSDPWHFSFQHGGFHYRFSLDRVVGRLVQVTKKGKAVWTRDLASLGTRITSKTEALAEADRLRTAIRDGAFTAPPAPPQQPSTETLEAYAREWLRVAPNGLKASTIRFYTDHLENHILPLLGTRPVADVKRSDVKALIGALREKKLRPTTIGGIVRTLSTILSEAVEDERLPANPALRPGRRRLNLRDPDAPKKAVIDPYTREEAALLVETAREHYPEWHPFVLCALRTGLRLGELRALQWGDFDWRNRFVQVERNFVEGKLTTTKSGKARRVDMSLRLRAALRLWRRQQRIDWFKRGLPQPQWVFPSSAATPLDDSKVRKAMLAILTKADVRRRPAVVHVMRHTFASLLIQQGESVTYVKEQMGHSSIQITVDVYGHLVPGGNRAAVDRLDGDVANGLQTGSQRPSAEAVNRQIA